MELLAPAGNLDKLKTAVHFGADAVYFFQVKSLDFAPLPAILTRMKYLRLWTIFILTTKRGI